MHVGWNEYSIEGFDAAKPFRMRTLWWSMTLYLGEFLMGNKAHATSSSMRVQVNCSRVQVNCPWGSVKLHLTYTVANTYVAMLVIHFCNIKYNVQVRTNNTCTEASVWPPKLTCMFMRNRLPGACVITRHLYY